MTRINLVEPSELYDQHLVAEHCEILLLCAGLRRTLNSKRGFVESKVPKRFTLNKGHMYFFYNKGKYLHERFLSLQEEMRKRGCKPTKTFPADLWPLELYNDWEPTEEDKEIVRERIRLRVSQKPEWYKYYGRNVG